MAAHSRRRGSDGVSTGFLARSYRSGLCARSPGGRRRTRGRRRRACHRLLRRPHRDPRRRRAADPRHRSRLRRQRRLGPVAVVQRPQHRIRPEHRAGRLRTLQPDLGLRAARGPLRLHLDRRLRDVPRRQRLGRRRREVPQPQHRRAQDGIQRHDAERRPPAPPQHPGRSPRLRRQGLPGDRQQRAGLSVARAGRRYALRRPGSAADADARRRSRLLRLRPLRAAGARVPLRAALDEGPAGRHGTAGARSVPAREHDRPDGRPARHRQPLQPARPEPRDRLGRHRGPALSARADGRSELAGAERTARDAARPLPPERAGLEAAARAGVRRLRPELPRGRARLEPRREPAGRAGAEGGLRRPRAVRQPALDARRQAEHRLGQDGAVPHHGPVQPAGHRARVAPEPRGVAHRALVVRGVWSFYDVGPLEDVRLELGRELRPVRADGPRPLRRALHAESRLRQDRRPLRPRPHRQSALAGEIRPPDPWDDTSGPRVRRAPRVPLGPLQLRDHRLLRLRRLPVRRADLLLRAQRRSAHRRAATRAIARRLRPAESVDGDTVGLSRLGRGRAAPSPRQPAALRRDLCVERRLQRARPLGVLHRASSIRRTRSSPPLPPTIAEDRSAPCFGLGPGQRSSCRTTSSGAALPVRQAQPRSRRRGGRGPSATPVSLGRSRVQQEALLGCGPFWQSRLRRRRHRPAQRRTLGADPILPRLPRHVGILGLLRGPGRQHPAGDDPQLLGESVASQLRRPRRLGAVPGRRRRATLRRRSGLHAARRPLAVSRGGRSSHGTGSVGRERGRLRLGSPRPCRLRRSRQERAAAPLQRERNLLDRRQRLLPERDGAPSRTTTCSC